MKKVRYLCNLPLSTRDREANKRKEKAFQSLDGAPVAAVCTMIQEKATLLLEDLKAKVGESDEEETFAVVSMFQETSKLHRVSVPVKR